MQNFLSGRSLTKRYKDGARQIDALKDVTLTIGEGEAVALMGPSGSGKSTLLHILGLLNTPTSGQVSIAGEVLDGTSSQRARWRNKNFGYIYQDYAIIETDTVFSNIAIPLEYTRPKIGRKEITRRVTEAANNAGINWPLKTRPSKLSGGERQRVAIARALVNNPKIVLADEPTGALDTKTANHVLEQLLAVRERNASILISTHDPNVAAKCDRTIHIIDGQLTTNPPPVTEPPLTAEKPTPTKTPNPYFVEKSRLSS